MSVIDLNKGDKEIIAALERLLKLAKSGSLTSLIAVVDIDDSVDFEIHHGTLSPLEVVGSLAMLHHALLSEA